MEASPSHAGCVAHGRESSGILTGVSDMEDKQRDRPEGPREEESQYSSSASPLAPNDEQREYEPRQEKWPNWCLPEEPDPLGMWRSDTLGQFFGLMEVAAVVLMILDLAGGFGTRFALVVFWGPVVGLGLIALVVLIVQHQRERRRFRSGRRP
jgi:hypothetical protein